MFSATFEKQITHLPLVQGLEEERIAHLDSKISVEKDRNNIMPIPTLRHFSFSWTQHAYPNRTVNSCSIMKPLRNELGTNKVWPARYVAALFTSERDQAHLRDRDLSVIARFWFSLCMAWPRLTTTREFFITSETQTNHGVKWNGVVITMHGVSDVWLF